MTPVHDLAVKKISVEPQIEFTNTSTTKTRQVFVRIQNRSPHPEVIQDLAMLGQLVTLSVESFGPCPAPVPVLVTATPQVALPLTLPLEGEAECLLRHHLRRFLHERPEEEHGREPGP